MDNKKMPKNAEIYFCTKCNFKCSKESNYLKHLSTDKHRRIILDNEKMPKNAALKMFSCICGKSYNYASGLSKHKSRCKKIEEEEEINKLKQENLELHKELNKALMNARPSTTNNINNNNLNINIFLNEQCKDAINMSEFVNSIQIELSDVKNMGKLGYVEGLSNIIVKNLNALGENKRPIHCENSNNDIMYIKDEDKWEKDICNEKLKEVVSDISDKNIKMLHKVVSETNMDDDVQLITQVACDDNKKRDEIIKNIAKSTTI
jgi:hypothetical protein